ncbi:MAG: hypothetical protein S4CHLAM7_02100 [Chlamydiae bacterium]|nr:hypothetical protein [Chlamydiota bacterium]
MISSLFDISRLAIGAALTYQILSPDPLEGKSHPEQEYQDFVSSICKLTNLTRPIFVREVNWDKNRISSAASTYTPLRGIGQILIPKGIPFPKDEVKLITAHELGHLANNHQNIATALLLSNTALLALPIISLSTALSCCFLSAVSLIPLFMAAERQADTFALEHTPLEILQSCLDTETERYNKRSLNLGLQERLLEFFIFRTEERYTALKERVKLLTS